MSLAPARWFFPGLLGSDVDEEEQAALELEMDLRNCTIMDPRLVVPAANFYHWYDHRSTLDELQKRFPSGGSNSWRSQFRFERQYVMSSCVGVHDAGGVLINT